MKPLVAALTVTIFFGARSTDGQTIDRLVSEVRAAETAFAQTMVARDLDGFASHVSNEAVFFGAQDTLRGRSAVVAAWRRFFEGAVAPFSWTPTIVEVVDSGTLAITSGPVRDPDGRQIGTFNSIWRREGDGRWRVVFDKGCQ